MSAFLDIAVQNREIWRAFHPAGKSRMTSKWAFWLIVSMSQNNEETVCSLGMWYDGTDLPILRFDRRKIRNLV